MLFSGVTQHIRITGTTAPAEVDLPAGARKTIVVPLRPAGGVCHVHLDISPARRPSDYPALNNSDPRLLGVLVAAFQYGPASG